jgi:hypothetical protein
MSTNINITVGDSGLLDRARQQQAASRQAQLNREASVQLEAEAITALLTNAKAIASGAAFNAARTAAFAAQGRDAQGNLITAPSRIQPYIAPRPAANRRGEREPAWLLVPSDAGFQPRVRGIQPFQLYQFYNYKIGFLSNSGPNGTSALYGSTEINPGVDEDITYRQGIFTNENTNFVPEPSGKAFTLEAMFKLPPHVDAPRGPFSAINFTFGALSMEVARTWSMQNVGLDPEDIPITETVTPYTTLLFTCSPTTSTFYRYYSNDIDPFPTYDTGLNLQPLRLPNLATTEWQHVAIVQTPGSTEITRNVSYYWGGQRVALLSDIGAAEEYTWPQFINVQVQTQFGNLVPDYEMPWQSYVVTESAIGHGFRFTSRALYTGDTYVPPTSITALA